MTSSTVSDANLTRTSIPEVGDFATQQVGSDAYPYIVTAVSASGARIRARRLECQIVSGSFMSGDAVVEYWANPNLQEVQGNWAPKRNRYLLAGSPLLIGKARFYQDPSY